MSREIEALLSLTNELAHSRTLEDMLQRLVDRTAALLDVNRATVRLLDDSGQRLLVGARAGAPLHEDGGVTYTPGEGLVGWVVKEAKPLRLANAEEDARFVRREGKLAPLASFLGVPLIEGPGAIGVLAAVHSKPDYFTEEQEQQLILFANMCAPYLQIARLRRMSSVDPLTGALNRKGLDDAFPEVSAPDADDPLSVILVDVDHFAEVNDKYGRELGDEVLKTVARILGSICRRGDAVVRLGGEEFLLVLPGASRSAAMRVAERARATIEAHTVICDRGAVSITVSAGVAERGAGEGRDDLVKRADLAMANAKQLGRNRVASAA
jgi:diguanylate cyclase (GGDEF)-like protein